MMKLSDIRDFIATLGLAEYVYMGKLDAKKEKAIGVYNSKHAHSYQTAIGGPALKSYGIKYVSFLVHWNKSPRETENAAVSLFKALEAVREKTINNETIKFIQLLTNEPVDVGTDDAGIYEMVIEAAVIYQKEDK
ncbi:MAG: hypothetical protein J6C37_10675 [Roseburia sp.]|nr:hypothetical protein [Roseburia sp.]